MKHILLQSMKIDNFKGIHHCVLDFGGKSCVIVGDNATGKSSICDAWHWLLFGKNQAGETTFNIKPLDRDGNVLDPSAVTSVEARITVDSSDSVETTVLRRTYYEKWSQKRGSAEKTFDGNTSDFSIDGVPMKKSEYELAIREMIAGEDIFTLITSLYAFNEGLDMKSRRRVLYDMCGVQSDLDILSAEERFQPLKESIGKFSIEELKKKLNSERQSLNKEKLKIPARIDECRKMVDSLNGIDFDGLTGSLVALETEREQLSGELLRIENNAALAGKENELTAMENKLEAVKVKRESLETRNRLYRKNQEPKRDTSFLDAWRVSVQAAERGYEMILSQKKLAESEVAELNREVDSLRTRWSEIAKEQLTVVGRCPTCGRDFDKDTLARAKAAFEADKAARKDKVSAEALRIKNKAAEAEKKLAELQEELHRAEKALDDIRNSKPAEDIQEVIIVDLPEYENEKSALEKEADKIRGEMETIRSEWNDIRLGSVQSRTLLGNRLREVRAEIEQVQRELGRKAALEDTLRRIDELKAEDRELALSLNENDRMQFLCEEFIRYKVSLIEDGVNSRFRIARFKLFDVQVNGALVDCCEATADGVPYGSVNHGMAVNLGLDIIETLSEYYGIRAPLFIDNGESVTKYTEISSQVIRLCVSERDKVLRLEQNVISEMEKTERKGEYHESETAA